MSIFGILVALFVLFYVLGKAADSVVLRLRVIAERIGIGVFFLGIILGLLTSLPELTVGLTALANGVPDLSVGNLWGGVIVLFGLILGGSLVLNRKQAIDGKASSILPLLAYSFLPLLLSLDGSLSFGEGFVLVVGYLFLVWYLYTKHRQGERTARLPVRSREVAHQLVSALAWLAVVVVSAGLIVRLARLLLEALGVSPLVIGLLVFSLGTNLPELIVTIRSWVRHIRELSYATLVGSAIANAFIIGLFALIRPIPITLDPFFYVTFAAMALLFVALFYFYEHKRTLTENEGFVLITIYLCFVAAQLGAIALVR
jgi:cation:H+ antiporter